MSNPKYLIFSFFFILFFGLIFYLVFNGNYKNLIDKNSPSNPEQNVSSQWAESMASKYPFNKSLQTGIVVFPAATEKILIIGKLTNLEDKNATISLGDNLSIQVTVNEETKYIHSSPNRENPVYKQVDRTLIEAGAQINVLAKKGDKPIAEELQQII